MPQYAQPSILLWLIAKKNNEHEFKSGNYVNLFTHDFKTVECDREIQCDNFISKDENDRFVFKRHWRRHINKYLMFFFLCSASRRRWHNAGLSTTYNQHWLNISWLLPLSHSSIVVVFFICYYQTRNSGWKSAQHQPEVSNVVPWLRRDWATDCDFCPCTSVICSVTTNAAIRAIYPCSVKPKGSICLLVK